MHDSRGSTDQKLLAKEGELCAMESKGKRKYRGGEFGVNIATSVPPNVFCEIEKLTKVLAITKSEVVRRLVLVGLNQYRRDGKLETDFTGDQSATQCWPR